MSFDCGGDASAPRGGREEEKGGYKKDPNLVGILLSSSVESEPLCEMASEWTPMPQPLVVDGGAAVTVIPRTWFPSHKTVESEGSKHGVSTRRQTAALWKSKVRKR